MSVTIKFLGAAGTVTGSKYLVQSERKKILVDCGLFQGERLWRERNWHTPEVDLGAIEAVLVTHAHLDHIGMLPRYFALGLRCPVYCTKPTAELARLLLLDSGHLQEEEARYRAKSKRSRHDPPLPLYTRRDAEDVLKLFTKIECNSSVELFGDVHAEWRRMGHILGATSIKLAIGGRIINFSGDIGRYNVPILHNPEPVEFGDLLLIESTYGDSLHGVESPAAKFAGIINSTYQRGGAVVIPSFAVGRTQLLLYYIRELKAARTIPDLPVIIDSPMAADATSIYAENPGDYDDEALKIARQSTHPFTFSKLRFVQSVEESKALNSIKAPMIIISASGMLSGGRILHHLRHRISNAQNTILFVGHQPKGGRGDWIKSGASSLRLLGEEVPIRAKVEEITGLSAHADRDELLRWCREGRGVPGQVRVVHGEPETAQKFKGTLEREFKWKVEVAQYLGEMVV